MFSYSCNGIHHQREKKSNHRQEQVKEVEKHPLLILWPHSFAIETRLLKGNFCNGPCVGRMGFSLAAKGGPIQGLVRLLPHQPNLNLFILFYIQAQILYYISLI